MSIVLPTSGLQCLYYADTGVTSSGGVVTQWNDQSGNGNHATQPTSGKRPTTSTSSEDGAAAIAFNGSQCLLIPTGVGVNFQNFTLLIVADQQMLDGAYILFGTPSDSLWFYIDQNISTGVGGLTATVSVQHHTDIGCSKRRSTYFCRSSSTAYIHGFGCNENGYSTGALASGSASGASIGATYTGSIGLKGKVYAVALYNRVLSNLEMLQARVYLQRRCFGHTCNELFIWDGDSRISGWSQTHDASPPAQLRDLLGGKAFVANFGVPGQNINDMLADFDTQIGALVTGTAGEFSRTIILNAGDYNNQGTSNDFSSSIIANHQTYGAKIVALGADGIICTTPKGSTIGNVGALNTVNAWKRSSYASAGYLRKCDWAGDLRFNDYTDLAHYKSDNVHFTDLGAGAQVQILLNEMRAFPSDVHSGVYNGVESVGTLDIPVAYNTADVVQAAGGDFVVPTQDHVENNYPYGNSDSAAGQLVGTLIGGDDMPEIYPVDQTLQTSDTVTTDEQELFQFVPTMKGNRNYTALPGDDNTDNVILKIYGYPTANSSRELLGNLTVTPSSGPQTIALPSGYYRYTVGMIALVDGSNTIKSEASTV